MHKYNKEKVEAYDVIIKLLERNVSEKRIHLNIFKTYGYGNRSINELIDMAKLDLQEKPIEDEGDIKDEGSNKRKSKKDF